MPDQGAGKLDHGTPPIEPEKKKKSVADLLLAQDTGDSVTPPEGDPTAVELQTPDDGSGPGKSTPAPKTEEAAPTDPPATPPKAAEDEPPEVPEVDPNAEPTPKVEDDETTPDVRGRTHTFEGKETFVSDDEAHNGYLRTADYTRKTQAAAEARKQAEAAAAETRAERVKIVETIQKMETALAVLDLKEPDATKMSPAQFAEATLQYQALQKRKTALATAKQAELDRIATEETATRQTVVEQEFTKLVELVPEWIDDSKRATEFKDIHDDLVARGFSEQQIDAVDDHRLWLMARDAAAYRRLKAQERNTVDKKLVGKIASATPGPIKPPKVVDTKREALTDLKKSRGDRAANARAAAKVFEILTEK